MVSGSAEFTVSSHEKITSFGTGLSILAEPPAKAGFRGMVRVV